MEDFYRNWLQHQSDTDNPEYDDVENNEESDHISEDESQHSIPTEIVYQTSNLKLIVEKGVHKRQKNFALQDHLFRR